MTNEDKIIALLTSIDTTLQHILALRAKGSGAPIASDKDLDGKFGNPVVKFMPRDWTGQSFKGRKMSDCPAELLDMLAETFDYFASKAEEKGEKTDSGKPVAPYKRADAARARGWALRIRSGKVAQRGAEPADDDFPSSDEWQ